MVPTLTDILALLDSMAPSRWAESWDNPGLQVGASSRSIPAIFLSLDPTLQALTRAVHSGARLLLTHHPLIFKPLRQVDRESYPGDVICEALAREVSIVSAHTNLDVAPGGINDMLADLLELRHVEVLEGMAGSDGAGLGRIGDLPSAEPLPAVVSRIKRLIGVDHLRVAGRDAAEIRRVAVVGGSGGSMVRCAAGRGADLLLTGDVGHHHALEAESVGIALVDGGHFHTERAAFRRFAGTLKAEMNDRGWSVTVVVDGDDHDPLRHM